MSYFVTGATGFIGRFLVAELLDHRDDDVFALVRASSLPRLQRLIDQWDTDRVVPVDGDLGADRLGLDAAWLDEHRDGIDHFFHLAAVYDMTADDATNEAMNVGGTRHALQLAEALRAGCFHQVSSVAAAGDFRGHFDEAMFDKGQHLPSPYHRTKFESEKLVREASAVPWRVYRPSIVVGDSQTGEMDKVDGPYYFFPLIRRLATPCRGGSRWSAPTSATRTRCPSTTSPRRWTTSPTCPTVTARPSISSTRSRSRWSTSSTCSARRPGHRRSRPRSTAA